MKKLFFLILCAIINNISYSEFEYSKLNDSESLIETPKIDAEIKKMAESKYLFFKNYRAEKYSRLTKTFDPETKSALIAHETGNAIKSNDFKKLHENVLNEISKLQEKEKTKKTFSLNKDFSGTLLEDLKNLEKRLRQQKTNKTESVSEQNSKNIGTKLENESNIDKSEKITKPLQPFAKELTETELQTKIQKLNINKAIFETNSEEHQKKINSYIRRITYQNDLLKGAKNQKSNLEKEYGSKFFTPEKELTLIRDLENKQVELNKLNEETPNNTNLFDKIGEKVGLNNTYTQKTTLIADIEKIKDILNTFEDHTKSEQFINETTQKIISLKNEQQEYIDALQTNNEEREKNQHEITNTEFLLKNLKNKEKALTQFKDLKEISN